MPPLRKFGGMYIESVPNRNSRPTVLLRESTREGKRVVKRTLANLSALPPPQVEILRRSLKGEVLVGAKEHFQVERTLSHGHVAAAVGTARKLGLEEILSSRPSPQRDLVMAMIIARVLNPRSKLATARGLDGDTAASSLGETLGVEAAEVDDLYEAMDWLLERQSWIERKLARRHLKEGTVVLYDVSSSYFEGRSCPLARLGFSRDGRKDKLQIVFGLLTDREGRPVAIEVFEGNTSDPATLLSAIEKLRKRFSLARVVLVGDRGMLTEARLEQDVRPCEGIEYITALRAPAVAALCRSGSLQLSLFDEQDLAEITSPDYPNERLIGCRNPLLAQERRRKREALLLATEVELEKIREATLRARRPLRGKDQIALRVGGVLGRFKVAKHFEIEITEEEFIWRRNVERIREETALDGIYVIRTSVEEEAFAADEVVGTYKQLSRVERAFRTMKSVDLKVRPIHHRLADRVRAHVLLCMLAYYVEWHMRRRLAPILFDDHHAEAAAAKRPSVVAKAERSDEARAKAATKQSPNGHPVHSFQTLLEDLATLSKNRVRFETITLAKFTKATPLQAEAFRLLDVSPTDV
jgi:hypothetical protein